MRVADVAQGKRKSRRFSLIRLSGLFVDRVHSVSAVTDLPWYRVSAAAPVPT
jgi:hypothetical protein